MLVGLFTPTISDLTILMDKLHLAKTYRPTFQSFTLHQVQIISLFQNPTFETSTKPFQIASINIKHTPLPHYQEFLWKVE